MTTSSKTLPRFIIGVDVGGTYTDIFALDEASGDLRVLKVRSTRGDQSRGFIEGVVQVGDLAHISSIVHGTTVATNALLERKVARTGVITTRGFRDVLEMRRRDRPQTWGLRGDFIPLIERDCRLEVDERVLADGSLLQEVDPDQVQQAARQLLAAGCEALSIVFLHSYANARNEQIALEAARAVWPNQYLSASHQILPEIREFERASTTSLNAALQPVVSHYLHQLESTLRQKQFPGQLLIVQSNGGVMDIQTACAKPVRTALSGPAAGVVACAQIAAQSGYPNVITGDMGGTSFDVSLVANGEVSIAKQLTVEFGLVLRTPMIEIQTIGAGGGSIASVDASGLLQVGPESAGSDPGPACFGLGSERPCVTDANVVLGRINSERPIGGKALDVAAARAAIELVVAKPLGLSVEAAAEAILAVANGKMAGAIRVISIERGLDPTQFAYMPFGGGGALHVCAMMRDVGCKVGLVPRFPGVTSALGCVIADMRHDFVQTLNCALDDMTGDLLASINQRIGELAREGKALLDQARMRFTGEQVSLELDMLYQGQTHAVSVSLPGWSLGAEQSGSHAWAGLTREAIAQAFDVSYAKTFGRTLNGIARRVLNLRVSVVGLRPKFDLSLLGRAKVDALAASRTAARQVWHQGRPYQTPVMAREAFTVGDALRHGPILIEQSDTTIWIEPGFTVRCDVMGNLVIENENSATTD